MGVDGATKCQALWFHQATPGLSLHSRPKPKPQNSIPLSLRRCVVASSCKSLPATEKMGGQRRARRARRKDRVLRGWVPRGSGSSALEWSGYLLGGNDRAIPVPGIHCGLRSHFGKRALLVASSRRCVNPLSSLCALPALCCYPFRAEPRIAQDAGPVWKETGPSVIQPFCLDSTSLLRLGGVLVR